MIVKLEDVCVSASSNLAQKDLVALDGGYPIYGAAGFIGTVDFFHQEKPYVAIVKDGAGIGRTMLLPAKSSVIGTMQYLLPKENILAEYLKYAVQFMHLEQYGAGATIPHIYFRNYKEEPLQYVAIEEQQKIVDVLDKISAMIACKKKELQALDELIKSRFVEMFGDPVTNPKGWEIFPLKELTSKIGSGATPKGGNASYKEQGISLIRSMNVYNGYFDYEGLAHIDEKQASLLDNVILESNDVLLNITGASVARCCIVPNDILPARVNQHVCILRCDQAQIIPMFLNAVFISEQYQAKLWNIAEAGATRQALSKEKIEVLPIIKPPLTLQNEFAAFVEQADKSKFMLQESINERKLLFDRLMQKYFGTTR